MEFLQLSFAQTLQATNARL